MNLPVRLSNGEMLNECSLYFWLVRGTGNNCYVVAKVQDLRFAEELRDHGLRIYDPDLKEFI